NPSAYGVLELKRTNTPASRGFSSNKGLLWSRPGGHSYTPAIPLRRRLSPTPLVLPCQAERGCPQRRSGARPLEQVNAVLSSLVSCIQAGTQLDRPGSPAGPPVARAPGGPATRPG